MRAGDHFSPSQQSSPSYSMTAENRVAGPASGEGDELATGKWGPIFQGQQGCFKVVCAARAGPKC